ncbi:hypothetical protein HY971_01280 [Candidatus Kaiserbacteria bacterium]|nr:hypothetical protein [Candidatus Kaiserbacteria bacterium]
MNSTDQPLNAEVYSTFLRFSEDELFVARQLALGNDLPKIDTQLQIKVRRGTDKESARELFTGMCGKLNLYGLSSEKAMLRAIGSSYKKFAEMCRASAQVAATQHAQSPKKNAKLRGTGRGRPEVPPDIIGYYKLNLDALAEGVNSLPARKRATLMHLRMGYETARQIAAEMETEPLTVNRNFNDIYKTLRIQHIKVRTHKRLIVRLAYLRWVETWDVTGKPGSLDSLDST